MKLTRHLIDDDSVANSEFTMFGTIQIITSGKSHTSYHHHCLSCGACLNSSGYEPRHVYHKKSCVERKISDNEAKAAFNKHVEIYKMAAETNRQIDERERKTTLNRNS